MPVESYAIWLDPSQTVSLNELVTTSGFCVDEVRELIDYGTLSPINREDETWVFSADCLVTVRKAAQLRDELELDIHSLTIVIALLAKINELETKLVQIRAVTQGSY
jgi:hypothetical protein